MKARVCIGVFLLDLAIGAAAFAESDAAAILQRVDETFLVDNISFDMRITSFVGEKEIDSFGISGASRMFGTINKTLVYFTEPSRVADRKMIMDANSVYILYPNTSNTVRLTPLQVLLGGASNGDVARTAFSVNYDVKGMEVKEVNGKGAYAFTLMIKPDKVGYTYPSARLLVDSASMTPISGEFFTASGKLIKKVSYGDNRMVAGKNFPFKLSIIDPEVEGSLTTLVYKRVQQKLIPENRYKRDFLEKLTRDSLR
jgi:hypothetical protein